MPLTIIHENKNQTQISFLLVQLSVIETIANTVLESVFDCVPDRATPPFMNIHIFRVCVYVFLCVFCCVEN